MSKNKDNRVKASSREKYNFDIAKGQGHTEVMNVCNTLSNGDILEFQMLFGYDEEQIRCGSHTKPCQKPYIFDLRLKVVSGT